MFLAFFITKIHITAMRLIIFLAIHLIIMAKSTISYVNFNARSMSTLHFIFFEVFAVFLFFAVFGICSGM